MEDYKLRDLRTVIGDPSKLRLIRKAAALARARPTFPLSPEEKAARRKWNPPCLFWKSPIYFIMNQESES
jgi:hypothetical protein